MTGFREADAATDPFEQFEAWYAEAEAAVKTPEAVVVATATPDGAPSARTVLLKEARPDGFVFFTNYGSRKGRELTANPHAAITQYWPSLDEQIRIEGSVELVNAAESDAYFAGRPRESQIGAWASNQSAELESRAILETRIAEIDARYAGQPIPRPPFWGGFRLAPERMEFWYARPGRLHERLAYTRSGGGWTTSWLYP